MILYKGTANEFREAVDTNQIADIVEDKFLEKLGRRVPDNVRRSWSNSMSFMEKIVRRSGVADDCGVMVEYVIPHTSKRIDFVIAGKDKEGNKNFIIVELKQWEKAEGTESDGIVSTFVGGGVRETAHPSYQANSYKTFLEDFNESVSEGILSPFACAYLHNYSEKNPEPLKGSIYEKEIEKAPLYFKDDVEKLESFISDHVGEGSGLDILYEIDSGRIRPSKQLVDYVMSMFEGNSSFTLIDEQKVAFETAKREALKTDKKTVVIVKGGPGTGKSIISVNLLGHLLNEELNTVFVAPNSSFRNVMIEKLSEGYTKKRLKHLFKSSAGFTDVEKEAFDVIIVDEAHRLKNGTAFQYFGDNQAEDIIESSKNTIFFIDDNQAIRPEDIGSVSELKRIAEIHNAEVKEMELTAQFRCSGAEGYVNWLDDVLHIEQTGNYDGWDEEDFDFKIFSNPNELHDAIKEKNAEGSNSRLLAGYAWKWTSAKKGNPDAEVDDVEMPEFDFCMPWNSRKTGTTWAIEKDGIDQVGCIHTSQGLEFDYVGIIVGDDLKLDKENLEYYTEWDDYKDSMGKRNMKENLDRLNKYVRNIYKILMSRGMKGCYVYFQNKEVEDYFRSRIDSKKHE